MFEPVEPAVLALNVELKMIWSWHLEIQKAVGEDGSEFELGKSGKTLFGRGSGYSTDDRMVSHHHVSFEVTNSLGNGKSGIITEPRVLFEVIGRNPIWVWSKKNGAISVFRKLEKGELVAGDRICLSGKTPLWFSLKQSEVQEEKRVLEAESEAAEISHCELNFDDMDVSLIDPVKEFGFIAMGHEFDHYPAGMIRNVKNWEWFLEEPSKDSEDEDEFEKREIRGMRGKRKKGKDNEDDEWTGESEDDKDVVAKTRKAKNSRASGNYTTRSKDSKGPTRDAKGSQNSRRNKASGVEETQDEDDETLGGFIVNDEEEAVEEENYEDEEEFEEEDDDEMEE